MTTNGNGSIEPAAADELENFFAEAELMDLIENYLFELDESEGLTVCLVPAREGSGKLRAVMTQNPPWYQRFVSRFENCRGIGRKRTRRPRTFISRVRTVTALKRILAGNRSGVYAERLLEFIGRELTNERSSRRAASQPVDPYDPDRIPF